MRIDSEFKVNEYITLKLEDNKTNIYVADELFLQCKKIILNINIHGIDTYDNARSIDEITELNKSRLQDTESINISPDLEFWGHCSNMQIWVENDYNTNLLHSNLSFPLLKRLTEIGDPRAKKVIREEILRMLDSGNENVILYLLENYYLEYFTEDELLLIYEDNLPKFKASKFLLSFLQAFSFQGLPIARTQYNHTVKELILARDFHKKIELLNRHTGFLSKEDFIYLLEEMKLMEASDSEKGDRFRALSLLMYELLEQYSVNISISDIITMLLREREQGIISNILLSSKYPYLKLDFQADTVRRRIWREELYYEFFEGYVVDLELLCDDSNEEQFYKSLKAIRGLKKLQHLNLLFLCEYELDLIEDVLLGTNIEKIKLYDFSYDSNHPKIWIIRD